MTPAALLLAVALAAAPDSAVATLVAADGPVEVVRADSPAAAAPAPLLAGDVVRTGRGGRARIEWPGGASLDLGPAAAARIGPTRLRTSSLTLLEGVGRVRLPPLGRGEALRVATPAATVGVRGTDFTTAVAADGATRVEVAEGEVGAGRDDPENLFSAGEAAEAEIGDEAYPVEAGEPIESWRAARDADIEARAAEVADRARAEAERARREGAEDLAEVASTALRIRGLVVAGEPPDVEEAAGLLADGLRLWRRVRARRARLAAVRDVLARLEARGADVGAAVAAWEAFETNEAAADDRVESLADLLERLAPLAEEGGGVAGFTHRLIRGLPLRWR